MLVSLSCNDRPAATIFLRKPTWNVRRQPTADLKQISGVKIIRKHAGPRHGATELSEIRRKLFDPLDGIRATQRSRCQIAPNDTGVVVTKRSLWPVMTRSPTTTPNPSCSRIDIHPLLCHPRTMKAT